MKTKIYLVALATLVLGAVFFVACSTDGENKEETNTKELNSVKYKITNGTAFISEFYGTSSWSEGKKTKTLDSLTTYTITEIIVGTDTRARGYLVTDYTTGGLLYFADVDRSKYILKAVDLVTEEQEIITNINTHPDYSLTDEFDFIKIIKDKNYTTNQKRRFWGSSWSQGPCDEITGLAQLYKDYYVLGIRVSHKPEKGDKGEDMFEPCGMR